MNHLAHLHIDGFRSIKSADIALRPLNVMIGANGAGKSNLIDFFRMLNHAVARGLQDPSSRYCVTVRRTKTGWAGASPGGKATSRSSMSPEPSTTVSVHGPSCHSARSSDQSTM